MSVISSGGTSVPPHPSPLRTLESGTLRVAAFEGFAPFAWNEGGLARGRDITFLQRFADFHGLTLEVRFHGFEDLWTLPGRDEVDLAASGISLAAGRKNASVSWTLPYASVRRTLLIRTGDTDRIGTMADLAFRRMAVVRSSLAHEHALEMLPQSASLSFCDSIEAGIDLLRHGKIDAVGTGSISAEHHLREASDIARIDVHEARSTEHVAFTVRACGNLLFSLNAFIAENAAAY